MMLSLNTLQGGLESCGIGPASGKENFDPTPKPKQSRKPRAKNVSTVLLERSSCFVADSWLLHDGDAPDTYIAVVGSMLLLIACAGGSVSVAPDSGSGCVARPRSAPVHAGLVDAVEDGLETPEEGTAGESVRRGGGDSAEVSMRCKIDEVDHIGDQIGGSDGHATNAHATERCSKRIRTSAP